MAIVSAVKIIGKKQPKKEKKMNLSVRFKKKKRNVDAPILYLPLYMLKRNFYFFLNQARKMLVKILQKVVDERKAMKKNGEQTAKRGMIDLMMEIEDESGKKLQDEDIVDLLIVLLLGAHDGPTHTIIWATIYLYGHPQILQKAKVLFN